MKKQLFLSALLMLGLTFGGGMTLTSCSDDDNTGSGSGTDSGSGTAGAADLDYTAENAQSWRNYSLQVARLLQADAQTLYTSWNQSYGDAGIAYKETFKNHNGSEYATAWDCVSTIIDKCVEITDEVGNTKIGDPYSKYMAGQTTEALYAVESWYSFRSREDYSNNIKSIRNSYYNSTDDSTISTNSLYNVVNSLDASLNSRVVAAIDKAESDILAIPQPFRNNIGDPTVPVAQASGTARLPENGSGRRTPAGQPARPGGERLCGQCGASHLPESATRHSGTDTSRAGFLRQPHQ